MLVTVIIYCNVYLFTLKNLVDGVSRPQVVSDQRTLGSEERLQRLHEQRTDCLVAVHDVGGQRRVTRPRHLGLMNRNC